MDLRTRRIVMSVLSLIGLAVVILAAAPAIPEQTSVQTVQESRSEGRLAVDVLEELEVKGRAPKTGYSRDEFGSGWTKIAGCDTRNIILNRDLVDTTIDEECHIVSGTLQDPYTGKSIQFQRTDGDAVQIDHVVALSDAWQKGAQQLTRTQRVQLANDPLELLAVDGPANQQKADGDAATWLPSNKPFRCQYVARQIAVKQKYTLWVTEAEKVAMIAILEGCPEERLPSKL